MLFTCPKCNQPFDLDPKGVNETHSVTCPHCQAHFDFGAPAPKEEPHEEATAVEVPVAPVPSSKELKNCPFCGEEILAVAKKCKHCGEWLDDSNPRFVALMSKEQALQAPQTQFEPYPAPQPESIPAPQPEPSPAPQPESFPAPQPQENFIPITDASVEVPVYSPQPEEKPTEPTSSKNTNKGCGEGFFILLIVITLLIFMIGGFKKCKNSIIVKPISTMAIQPVG